VDTLQAGYSFTRFSRFGIRKSLAFALLIAWVCTFKGFFAHHGAEGGVY
jgi:ABC-type transporter Mla maintaining outer membrane lipid asymmetry permease subunit MlaE